MGLTVPGSECRVQVLGFGVWGLGFRVRSLGFRVRGSGFGVQGSGFRVWGSGLEVEGVESTEAARATPCAPFTEMRSGSEEGSYFNLIGCITQL